MLKNKHEHRLSIALLALIVLALASICGCSDAPAGPCVGDLCPDEGWMEGEDMRTGRDMASLSDIESDQETAGCSATESRCTAGGQLESCVEGQWVATDCPSDHVCLDGECLPIICEPEEDTDCDEEGRLLVCNQTGTGYDAELCPYHWYCQDGQCVEGCGDPRVYCIEDEVWECTAGGEDLFVVACRAELGEQCIEGECLDRCQASEFKRDYVGCQFYAADLPNESTANDNIFAFAFANPWPDEEAEVTITYPTGRVAAVTVPPLSMATHELPVPRTLMVTGSGISHRGFFIRSSIPITSFMFNPLEQYDPSGATVATNDASLLIPVPIIGTEYLAMTWSDPGEYSEPPYVTVVATEDDTEVTVRPTSTIFMVVPPSVIVANTEATFELDALDVLNIQSKWGDLAGTEVTASAPVAVFSGNMCARVPDSGRFCDHIETQLPPVETWGNRFVVTKFTDRGGESDYYRIVALEDGTRPVFDPPRFDVPTLPRGHYYEFKSTGDFLVTSEKPILLGQFMASENMTSPSGPFGQSPTCPLDVGGSCWGDPSLVLVPPIEQLRSDYIYLVPNTYRYNFLNIAYPEGATVTIDGLDLVLDSCQPVGDPDSSDWCAVTRTAQPGYHTLFASAPVAVIVYGFDHNISYAYPAGLDFKVLLEVD
ncbi:MAG: IgGFc-binding protein [Bradymonadales bacterium]|nr:IgGFc-binding protein [Bradymonadales bacterium]